MRNRNVSVQVAETLNWELFCEKRPSELTEVSVRRIKVPISSNAKNSLYFENDKYSSLMSNIQLENLQETLEELIVPNSKWAVSKQGIHTCRREYLTPLANKDPEEEEVDSTEIEPMQLVEIPDKAEPMELETKPDVATSMFRTPSPSLGLRDELSKLMDIMHHMQWKQQAY
ncbi:hypothetical protein PVK06_024499 [Gossypium arboreum]|uniref:Uncharacterized protein n=1 Tax=Gossypium arboreum TaxID=29729 RepID=A0ABR0PE47_GOSAR|nr:hypothetical protein PVK06_024499 [Gossypium arboreum]